MRPVTAESIRSRQTGQVGSSYEEPGAEVIREIAAET